MMSRLRSTELTRGRKQWVFGLLRRNMKSLYEISNWVNFSVFYVAASGLDPGVQFVAVRVVKIRSQNLETE